MNINAINPMMINKNLRFKANEVPQEPQKPMANLPEGTVTNPQTGMNALANNNIAFQGLNPQTLKSAGRKVLLSTACLAMFLPALTSCQKEAPIIVPPREDINVNVNTVVNVDMNQISAILDYLKESNRAFYEFMNQWYQDYKADNASDKEFQEQMINYMIENKDARDSFMNIMIENGKTQEEANEFLEYILTEVKNGNMKASEAYDKIMAEIGEIKITLKEIKEMLANYFEEAAANAELEKVRDEARDKALFDLLKGIYEKTGNIEELNKIANDKLDRANDSLYKNGLNQEKIMAAIDNLELNYGAGLTVDEFKAIVGEQSEAWMAFLEYQFANQNEVIEEGDASIRDIVQNISDNMVTKEALNEQQKRFHDLIAKAIELGLIESQKIQDLIAGLDFSCNCEHNCSCGDKVENNEGILGDIEGALNGN